MLLGKVTGTVVATRKEPKLSGLRFLVVEELGVDMSETGKMVIAADAMQAGVGEVVLFAQGSSARQTLVTTERPVDATIMAIVDVLEVHGETRYDKSLS